jgi:hypothetical protein
VEFGEVGKRDPAHFQMQAARLPRSADRVVHFSEKPDPKARSKGPGKIRKNRSSQSIRAAGAAREVLSDGAEKVETLVSETATLKGYPSVLNESKFSRGNKSAYLEIAIIFAGPVMIRIQSTSPNQKLAKKTLSQFVDAMRIEEGPAPGREPLKPRQPDATTRSL